MRASPLNLGAVLGLVLAVMVNCSVGFAATAPRRQAPLSLTAATAKLHADEAIAAKYGPLWTNGTRKWSRCVDYTDLLDDSSAQDETWACYFDFKTPTGSYRFGSLSVDVTGASVTTEVTYTNIYGYRPRHCTWRPATALQTVRGVRRATDGNGNVVCLSPQDGRPRRIPGGQTPS